MSAVATGLAVRVMVLPTWDRVPLDVSPETTVAEVKRAALERATMRHDAPADRFLVKFRGGVVLDESQTLGALGVPPNGVLVVLWRSRQPVR